MQATTVGKLHDKTTVDRNALIALRSLASGEARLIGFVKLGLEVDLRVIDRKVVHWWIALTQRELPDVGAK
jgi:hypothetical protein